jgi:acetyl-CoA carboxylase carboxyl transferase subunit alpha
MAESPRMNALPFERPVLELEEKIARLRQSGAPENADEIVRLGERLEDLEQQVYSDLSPWEQVQLARHPKRPTMAKYIDIICDEFQELAGDRLFGNDKAIVGGLARIGDLRLVIVGHEKGRTTQGKIQHNFGMANPEGFRKALRIMKLAEKFKLPIVSFIDTPGAYPGVGAEERGQPRAIALNIREAFGLRTPIVVVIIGEGGSGGALALAVGDRILMMEHAIYSVISPEGCAAILWKSREKAPEAAASMRLTAADCLELGVVDTVIEELHGASHRDHRGNALQLREILVSEIGALGRLSIDVLMKRRENKFYSMGIIEES